VTPERYQRIFSVLEKRQTDLTVLMEQVHKEHNFSAILRTCDAVGIAEAHAIPPTRVKLKIHGNTSSGAGKWLAVQTHAGVEAAVGHLKDQGFIVVAVHPTDQAVDYRDVDFTRPIALMMGAELDGISPEGLALADETIVIPMRGMVQSLNVSVATAVVLYEALRQRERTKGFLPRRIPEGEKARRIFEWGYPRLSARCRAEGRPYPLVLPDGQIDPQAAL